MGRKNRNARSRGYSSFAELKSSTVRFDLSTGNFIKKARNDGTRNKDADININLISGGTNQGLCVSFSIKGDVAKKMDAAGGKYWCCGLVRSDGFERLYFVPDERGYALCINNACERRYMKMPIDDAPAFDKYVGSHDMQYDEINKAFYVTADK